jgi:hypothetical protein
LFFSKRKNCFAVTKETFRTPRRGYKEKLSKQIFEFITIHGKEICRPCKLRSEAGAGFWVILEQQTPEEVFI